MNPKKCHFFQYHIKKDKKTKAGKPDIEKCQWTDKHQKAFDHLKAHQTSMPVLGYPDFSNPFKLDINASL